MHFLRSMRGGALETKESLSRIGQKKLNTRQSILVLLLHLHSVIDREVFYSIIE